MSELSRPSLQHIPLPATVHFDAYPFPKPPCQLRSASCKLLPFRPKSHFQGKPMSAGGEPWNLAVLAWLDPTAKDLTTDEIQGSITTADCSQLESVIDLLAERLDSFAADPSRLKILMQLLAVRKLKLSVGEEVPGYASTPPQTLARLYEQLLDIAPQAAPHALQILASQPDEESITCLAELLIDTPPDQWLALGVGLSPLWNAPSDLLELFFDRMDACFLHPAMLAVLLDLANYSTRGGRLSRHPLQARQAELVRLLDSLVQQLRKLERQPSSFGQTVEQVQRILSDSVALALSLCDALGLIGEPNATEALKAAMTLSHRRIQTEAAGALARLGCETGRQRIIELASDRAARLRAVAYADELGFVTEIDEALRIPQALAESELASWLSAPQQYGIAPNTMELIDSRIQYWPGFEEPQDCFLFRFTFVLSTGAISQVGMAGCLTHAFHTLPAHLPVEDLYAAFAGWQTEHEEIFEVPMTELNPAQRRQAERLMESLQQRGLEVIKPLALTFFFGEIALLAEADREGLRLGAITDGNELLYFPLPGNSETGTPRNSNPMAPELLLCLFRGRKLLRTFNPSS